MIELKNGLYWVLIDGGWRVVEVDLDNSVHSGGDYYVHGVQRPRPLRSLDNCQMKGPLQAPDEQFNYRHPVVMYEVEAA